jgi:hypothetical protein
VHQEVKELYALKLFWEVNQLEARRVLQSYPLMLEYQLAEMAWQK